MDCQLHASRNSSPTSSAHTAGLCTSYWVLEEEGRVGEGLGRDLRLGMLSWSSWGFCLPRALLEGTGASRFSVFTGVITHTHIDTHTDTHIHIATHTHTHTHIHTQRRPLRVKDSVSVQFSSVAQSCPTLCDPIDGSPPGSPVPGILQARSLE